MHLTSEEIDRGYALAAALPGLARPDMSADEKKVLAESARLLIRLINAAKGGTNPGGNNGDVHLG